MDERKFLVELRRNRYEGGTCITCGREENQLHADECLTENAAAIIDEQADEIERLRAQLAAMWTADHEMMWEETLIPIAEALGVSIVDEHGENRRQFQMVEAIVEKARHV